MTPPATAVRQHWMALLARAPLDWLEDHVGPMAQGQLSWLRQPETGLYLVQARAGGTGLRFHAGEATVTRCVLKTDPQLTQSHAVGVAYVMGCSHRLATLVAVADALLQDPSTRAAWHDKLVPPLEHMQQHAKHQQQAVVQSTKVEFFTVAREVGEGVSEDVS